jgi:hypothetical protein
MGRLRLHYRLLLFPLRNISFSHMANLRGCSRSFFVDHSWGLLRSCTARRNIPRTHHTQCSLVVAPTRPPLPLAGCHSLATMLDRLLPGPPPIRELPPILEAGGRDGGKPLRVHLPDLRFIASG